MTIGLKKKHFLQPDWPSGVHHDRIAEIVPYVSNKDVLDVGAANGYQRKDLVHAQLAKHARRIVGIDIDAAAVAGARALGYDVRLVDAQSVDVGETFDVVFAGELIEHLSDFSGFLAAARRHLRADGLLVLTTPNAFSISNFVYRIGGKAKVHHEHTCWFCEDTLATLLHRSGFEVTETKYLRHQTPGRLRSFAARTVRGLLPDRVAWRTLLMTARVSRP